MSTRERSRSREEHDRWLAEHDEYLQSPEWIERRTRVIARSGGLCEGCRKRRPTQVHHLTYRHWKRELLFELVALCDRCHDLAHDKSI